MAATKNSVSPTASEKPAIEPVTVSETMPVATTPAPSASSERRSDHSASPEGAASRSEPRTTSKATEPTGRRRSATASGTTPNAAHISFRAMSAGVYPACNA